MDRRTFVSGMALAAFAAARPGMADAEIYSTADLGAMAWPSGDGHALTADTADAVRWMQIDLGRAVAIDAVRLYPKWNNGSGYEVISEGFPKRFRIEAATDTDFRKPVMIADRSGTDQADPGNHILQFPCTARARYIRITATALTPDTRPDHKDSHLYLFALAKVDVLAGGGDMAEKKPVSDSASGAIGASALTRPARPMGETIVTDNPQNVTPGETWRKVSYRIAPPSGGLTLTGGPLHTGFHNNIGYLLSSFTADEVLREFNETAGRPIPPGLRDPSTYWSPYPGSNAGRFLMGAGNSLKWTQHDELRDRLNTVVDGVAQSQLATGYILAYPETDIMKTERSSYARAWLTHGLLASAEAGRTDTYRMLRGYYDWFNQCRYLPKLMRGVSQGHQGAIASVRIANSPIGKPQDAQVVQRHYQENYWLEQLARRDTDAIWQYPYDHPHCYLINDLQTCLELYATTGDERYLAATDGGWEMFRDHWVHIGGSIAITERYTYPDNTMPPHAPGSYHLHAKTGEMCGNTFWALLNYQLLRLRPGTEKYVAEIEKSLYNVALANQVDTHDIRYHANLEGRKDPSDGRAHNTCCEGQGTRLLATIPEFMYSVASDGLYVNLYEASTLTWAAGGQDVTLRMETAFPYQSAVALHISAAQPVRFNLRVRIPGWAGTDVPVLINGALAATGRPGSFLALDRTWQAGDSVTFTLPMAPRLTHYLGADRIPGRERYAVEYGPLLLALVGTKPGLIGDTGNAVIDLPAAGFAGRLQAVPGRPLCYSISGAPDYEFQPYWTIADQTFSCFPGLQI